MILFNQFENIENFAFHVIGEIRGGPVDSVSVPIGALMSKGKRLVGMNGHYNVFIIRQKRLGAHKLRGSVVPACSVNYKPCRIGFANNFYSLFLNFKYLCGGEYIGSAAAYSACVPRLVKQLENKRGRVILIMLG